MTAAKGSAGARRIRAGGRTAGIGHPDRILCPGDGTTKADLTGYYRTVARRMLPHLRGRPLRLERRPAGTQGPEGTSPRRRGPGGPRPRPAHHRSAQDGPAAPPGRDGGMTP
ncbi:hypothetical protein [Streptomyces virginiae]|uniref:non-homologous end-joining DNA ligase LigD n=1 Tax=Streptomyces virginiae TaxID=1961 RepID=UPI003412E8CD